VRISFTVRGNCKKCHSGNSDFSKPKFKELAVLPRSGFADGIDWVKAEQDKLIIPAAKHKEKMPFTKEIVLQPAAKAVAPVVFSHKLHGNELECSSCHPEPFNFKQKRTTHFTMKEMLGGEFCGTCHLNVAFPLHNCQRCHAGIPP
jgi:c(7)-type cytochrome triheme protein